MNSTPFPKKSKLSKKEYVVSSNFPDWEELLKRLTAQFASNPAFANPMTFERLRLYLRQMPHYRKTFRENPMGVLREFAYHLAENSTENFEMGMDMEEGIRQLEALEMGTNEFYTLFEIAKNDYTIIDRRISQVLGFEPEQFSLMKLLGIEKDGVQLHVEDAPHMARSAFIGYMVTCIPGFKWTALKDFYRARTRIYVGNSKIEEIRKLGIMTMEKKVYISSSLSSENTCIPTHHLKRWSVYTESEYTGTCPYFGSDPYQSTYRNAYWYLLHASLLDIPIKYLLLLNERQFKDRYKAISLSINNAMSSDEGMGRYLDEGQVADCFAKTIRPKIAEAINIWENPVQKLIITSDQEAVAYAQRLGLLPVPKKVLEIIYQNIDAI